MTLKHTKRILTDDIHQPLITEFQEALGKPMKQKRITPEETSWKKPLKPITNATVIASVAVLVIPLSALGVLALSNCGALRVQLNPFELQLIKGSCSIPPDLGTK